MQDATPTRFKEIERMNGTPGNGSVSRKIARLVEKVKTLPRRKQNQVAEYVEFLSRTHETA